MTTAVGGREQQMIDPGAVGPCAGTLDGAGEVPPDGRCRPGRPRSAAVDAAIATAALEVFAEVGYGAMTIEAVADRAGVARSTVYRRFPGKPELLLAAAHSLTAELATEPDTGSLAGDLTALARSMRDAYTTGPLARVVPAVVAATACHPEVVEPFRTFLRERRAGVRSVVARAVARGELPEGGDPTLVADLVAAPIFYRVFVSGDPVDDDVVAQLVDHATRPSR